MVNADPNNVVGNFEDKYASSNPIARMLVAGFLGAVTELFVRAQPGGKTVLEVGCGEGKLATHLIRNAPGPSRYLATDVSLGSISAALDTRIETQVASIYDLPFAADSFDVVVCCEVLEHLEDPARGLAQISRVAREHVLLSTPKEPVWRAMNMARGKYLRALGNTPGHIQHFSRRELQALAATQLQLLEVRTPLPWTVILGKPLPLAKA
ncbi:3-demethylubiquinone-9 3-methyltransferase domain protein [Enhygromyxa salina]|uniref:3-demethylubiquinone-9 3-methyltransferase domain protein n=1 Tax=Enhygromyxa salina TaxID=215803 RepID=A0A0C2A091_9BACT|nr:class I SAM-dependent methyltransferase [Enhygromyxa salina]KIG16788.1 3-demethylubiquinone-9 3-methyltransferase domain protein [Enhygromyxa salina]